MSAKNNAGSPTMLSNSQFEECIKVALRFLHKNQRIRNRDIREVAGIGYDQAIRFFNRAIAENLLIRNGNGSGSGTYYTLPQKGQYD
jgi:predicted HTH transcriptional regulator